MTKKATMKWFLLSLFFLLVSESISQVSRSITYLYSFSEGLYSPLRIATDDAGDIYITDARKHRVTILDTLGNIIGQIDNIYKPLGIAVDNRNRIYIGDHSTHSVSIFSSEGIYLGKLGSGDGQFTMPTDIVIDSQGKIYVVDSGENCVKVFNAEGSYSFQFGDERLKFPTGIAIDESNDEILVGQYGGSAKIHMFDMAGRWKNSFGSYGHGQGEFTSVQGLAVDDLGRIYVTDAFQSVVQIVDHSGNFLANVGGFGTEPGLLRIPLDVTIDKNNRLLITSMNNKRIEVYKIIKDIIAAADDNNTFSTGNALFQNYPNPFNPGTWIPYALKESSHVTIRIYDMLGRLTKTIDVGFKPEGIYLAPGEAAYWDGRNDQGKVASNGIYFCEIHTKDFVSFRKIILLK